MLVIDDDAALARMLQEFFSGAGWVVDVSFTGHAGLSRAVSEAYDMVLLDVMLPDADGFALCRALRAQSAVPVLMLTACGDDGERIRGLELGADDYLPKPFNPRELRARVDAISRRQRLARMPLEAAEAMFVHGVLTIDPRQRLAWLAQEEIALTGLEFNLLLLLARQPGQTLSRAAILAALHGTEYCIVGRSVDVHISSLRKKLRAHLPGAEAIKTVRGEGYVFCLPDEVTL
jgi:DNA-binding response OmpR family regulator